MKNPFEFKSPLAYRVAPAIVPEKRPIARSILADARARVHSAQVKPESMTSAQIARVLATLPRIAPIYVSALQVRKDRREGGLFTVGQLVRR